jgi:hypothetical protein
MQLSIPVTRGNQSQIETGVGNNRESSRNTLEKNHTKKYIILKNI